MVDVRSGWSVPIYTPSRTASKSPASAAARRSTPLPGRFRSRGMRMALSGLAGPLLFDCGTDVADRRTRRMHLHRLLRHVEADGAFHAGLRPLGDVAVCAAFLDETILVAAVAAALTPPEAADRGPNLRIFSGKPVCGGDHLG